MAKYTIIDKRILNESENHRAEIHLINVHGKQKIRFCYYSKLEKEDGSIKWNFTLRPLQIPIDELERMKELIDDLIKNNP